MLDDQTLIDTSRPDHSHTPYRALFASVLICGMNDAAGHVLAVCGGGRVNENVTATIQRQAQAWLGSKDFREVCELAGFEPDAVLKAYHRGVFPIKGQRGRYSQGERP